VPLLSSGQLTIDYTDEGEGDLVVLVHSSVSGNRQWRALAETLARRHRVRAINLFGYGETTPWPAGEQQSLYAQAQLVLALCRDAPGTVSLVGHSFGGSVALKAALLLGARLARLVLLEPNPFYLLGQAHRTEAWLEARSLRDHVKCFGALGDWPAVAERFADYWLGDGSWAAMPDKRRSAFAASLPPNLHEWDAVMNEVTPITQWARLGAGTLVVSDPQTRLPILEIVQLLQEACPHWSFQSAAGGHMAPLTRPELVNPLVERFLAGDGGAAARD
jgi:pimeloyl-ACP methyl ester carboxylesterase